MKRQKEIKIIRDITTPSGLKFNMGDHFTVNLLKIGFCGGFDRYPEDNTMEGSIFPVAVVEFENGKIMYFEIEHHIHIVGDAQ